MKYFLVLAVAGLTAYGVRAQAPAGALPDSGDIGLPSTAGSYTYDDAAGTHTVVGGGNDIWGTSDNFHYAWYEGAAGDFDVVVQVESLDGTHQWAKAQLHIRECWDGALLNPTGQDRHVNLTATRDQPDATSGNGQNEIRAQWRSEFGGGSASPTVTGADGSAFPDWINYGRTKIDRFPYPNTWLRVRREGSVFHFLFSADGVEWERHASLDTADTNFYAGGAWSDTDPVAIGLAVTSHDDAPGVLATGVFKNLGDHVDVPVAIVTQPEAAVDQPANSTVTLMASASGDICKTVWRKDGVDIPGTEVVGGGSEIVNNLTIQLAQESDSGTYTLYASGDANNVTSDASVVTITPDNTPPSMVSALGSPSLAGVTITFDEPVKSPSADTASNYTIAGLTVSGAVLSADEYSVVLTTSQQAENTVYTVTVSNVEDASGNVIAPGSTIDFNSAEFTTGIVQWERWNNGGGAIVDLINQYRDGSLGPADVTWNTGLFESGRGLGDNYWARGFAWFVAPATGDYRLIVTSDDNSRVFMSTDDDPANVLLTVAEGGWSNNRDWNGKSQEQDSETWVEALGTAEYNLSEWQDFPIPLEAGQRYFIEVFWQEGGGGDGLELTYTDFGAAVPGNNTPSAITGDLVGSYVDPTTLPPLISDPGANTSVTIEGGTTGTLSIVGTGIQTYQWQYHGVDIPGATSADYVIEDANPTHSGQYTCNVANANGTASSPLINVMVTATEVFAIEAEDFDYDGGQHLPDASVMPYLGGAYDGLAAIHGVDYNSGNGSGDSPLYRTGDVIADGTAAPMGDTQGTGLFAITRQGAWETTANYKIGWMNSGDWGNYTRTFPEPAQTYWVLHAGAHSSVDPSAVNGSLGIVTAGVGTADQTIDLVGSFDAPGTSGWGRNSLVPMTDDNGAIATVELGGLTTIRWNYNSGDAEYLIFTPATVAPGTGTATITVSDGNVVIAEDPAGGSTVQSATTIDGEWTDVGPAPQTVPIGTGAQFFRLTK